MLTAMVPFTISLCLSLAVALGGWHMANLKSYGRAVTGAALAILPCSVGCFLGLPMGVWALIVLLDPKVRAAFGGSSAPLPRANRNEFSAQPGGRAAAFGTGCGVAALGAVALAVLLAILLPAVQAVRQSASQAQSSNNLKQ